MKMSHLQKSCINLLVENPHLWLTNINPDLHEDIYDAIAKSRVLHKKKHCQVQLRVNPAVVRPCGNPIPCGQHPVVQRCIGKKKTNGARCRKHAYYDRHTHCWFHSTIFQSSLEMEECAFPSCTKKGLIASANRNYCFEHRPAYLKCVEKTLHGKPCTRTVYANVRCKYHQRACEPSYQCQKVLADGKRCPFCVDRKRYYRNTGHLKQFAYCRDHCRSLVRQGKLEQIMIDYQKKLD